MEIRGKKIGGLDAVRVRDALRAFLDVETPMSFENGEVKIERKTLNVDFLAKELGLAETDGESLLADLIADGYIDKEKLTPTQQGMALAQAEDRDRLPLSEARDILNKFLDAVRRVNEKSEARVLVERVHVFGSYLAALETVGDIDLLIEAPLPDDCEPEDMDEKDVVFHEIKISDYLSFHDEFDLVATETKKCLIYERHNSN